MEEKQLSDLSTETKPRAWEPPTIEELDLSATEAAYGVPGTIDFGIYTT
jgi:hypothetical protein